MQNTTPVHCVENGEIPLHNQYISGGTNNTIMLGTHLITSS